MRLNVTEVTDSTIVCGPWTFNRDTGMEVDPELGWDGVNTTGSVLRAPAVFDQAAFDKMTAAGKEAWKDVPDAAAWVREQRDGEPAPTAAPTPVTMDDLRRMEVAP